jgi:hypothetical protein
MQDLLTIGFEFKDDFYYSLIRVKEKEESVDYQVTVMNGDLEKLLYGNHIIKKTNGCLRIEIEEPTEQEMLKVSIAEALSTFLDVPLEISRSKCEV